MTCKEVQKVLPEVIDEVWQGELQAHLESCPACSELVAELELIASEARQLADSAEPPPRVWLAVAAELRAEGLIREPKHQPVPVAASSRSRWNSWLLVPVAAAALVAGAYFLNNKPAPPVANAPKVENPAQVANNPASPEVSQKTSNQVAKDRNAPRIASHSNTPAPESAPMEMVSNDDDQQFLQEVGTRAPHMKTTYENELRSVNSYIRDARAYVAQHPEDEDARQHLMDAYEQKAMLYQMALDHIQ